MSIEIRVAQSKDYDSILEFLFTHYYTEEPLSIGINPTGKPDAEDVNFNMSQIEHGTCVVALELTDSKESGEVVGVFLAGPKYPDEAEHILDESKQCEGTGWSRILKFLAAVEQSANVFKRYNVTKAVHGHVLAVHERIRGKALGAKLVTKAVEVAESLGYPIFTADCTSLYSARLFDKLGFDLINQVEYADYCDENGQQVFNPPSPHTGVKTYAKKLGTKI